MVIAMVGSLLLRFALRAAGLSLMDRLLGGLFGLARIVLVAAVLLMIVNKFFPSARAQLEAESALAPFLFRTAEFLEAFLDKHNAIVQHLQQQIRELLRQS
jgi:uncharacterized membrane protein required for colicin V production